MRNIILPDRSMYPDKISLQAGGIESCASAYFDTHRAVKYVFLKRLQEAISLIPSNREYSRVLDLGTGIGALLPTLHRLLGKANFVGIDYSSILYATKFMTQRGQLDRIDLVRGDIKSLPFHANTYDLIICLSVLEHISDLDNAFKEVRRVLRDDGILIVGWPCETTFLLTMRKIESVFLRRKASRLAKESTDTGEISGHVSHYTDLGGNLRNNFKILGYRAIPCNCNLFRLYEVYSCC